MTREPEFSIFNECPVDSTMWLLLNTGASGLLLQLFIAMTTFPFLQKQMLDSVEDQSVFPKYFFLECYRAYVHSIEC